MQNVGEPRGRIDERFMAADSSRADAMTEERARRRWYQFRLRTLLVLITLCALVMAWLTGWWLYIVFLPILVVVAVYMSAVRYDRDGNLREEMRQRR